MDSTPNPLRIGFARAASTSAPAEPSHSHTSYFAAFGAVLGSLLIFGLFGFNRAVTATMDRRTAERRDQAKSTGDAELLEARQRYALAAEGANDGIWDWNVATGEDYFSTRWKAILGYGADELDPHVETFKELLHPDDVDRTAEAIRAHLEDRVPYSLEFRLRHKSGNYIWVLAKGQALWDADGEPLRMAGSISDITDRKLTEQALRNSEAVLSAAQRIAGVGSWEIDIPTGKYRFSEELCKIMELDPDSEILGFRDFTDRVHPEDREAVKRINVTARDTGRPFDHEYRIMLDDGTIRHVHSRVELELDDNGQPTRMIGALQDITRRKEAEDTVRANEASLANAQRIARLGSWERNLITGEARYSREMRLIFGFDPETAHRPDYESYIERVHPEDRDTVERTHREAFRDRTTYDLTYRIVRLDGIVRTIHSQAEIMFDDAGEPIGLTGTALDITDQVLAEKALRESEERYRTIYNNTPVMLHSIDRDGRIFGVSDYWCETMGVPREEAIGRPLTEFLTDESRKFAVETGLPNFFRDGYTKELPLQFVKKNGEVMDILLSAICERDSAGEFTRSLAVLIDVTERNRAEAARKRSEANLTRAQRIAHIGSWERDIETGKGRFSDELIRITGVDAETFEPSFENFLELIHPDDRPNIIDLQNALVQSDSPYDATYRIVRPDGSVRHVRSRAEVTFDVEGRSRHVIGALQDVTDLALAEEAARESEAQLDAFFSNAAVGMAIYDSEGRYQKLNPALAKINGVPLDDHVGKRQSDVVPGAVIDGIKRNVEQLKLSGESSINIDISGESPAGSGKHRHWSVTLFLIPGRGGELTGSGSVVTDVTGRKRAEEALRESEEQLRVAQTRLIDAINCLPMGFNLFDADDRLILSNNSKELQPRGPGAPLEIGENVMDIARGTAYSGKVCAALGREEEWLRERLEYFRNPKGTLEIEHTNGTWIQITNRKTSEGGTAGLRIDITEQKNRERALVESEERLNAFFSNAAVGLAFHDDGHRYQKINKTLADMNGASIEDHIGRRPTEMLPIEMGREAERKFERIKNSGITSVNVEMSGETLAAPGDKRYWSTTHFPIPNADGSVGSVGVAVIDITEQKRMEDEVRKLNAELEQRVIERTAELHDAQAELVKSERMATLGQLTATVSHELRNPLGTMRTSIYVVRHGFDNGDPRGDQRVGRAIDRVERNIARCDKIIDELLDYTRITKLDLEPVEIDTWLGELLHDQNVPDNVQIRRNFSMPGLIVAVDQHRLMRTVINVYENARQALAERPGDDKGREAILDISTRRSGDRIEIITEDNGPGMPPDVLERVFEPLFSTKGFGVGLGLSVVRRIMEQHDGGIEIDTQPERGTRVVLWLPLREI